MGFFDEGRKEEDEKRDRNNSKMGDYTGDDCPNCSRQRIMKSDDGKHRCEKCGWCIEDNAIDLEFQSFLFMA